MINRQQSFPMGTVIDINLTGNDSYLVPDDSLSTTTITVKITDPVSSIFDAIGSPNRQDKIVFNGQILCPALSFAFYNIHNNDTISLISPQMPTSISAGNLSGNVPLKDSSSNRPVLIAAPLPLPITHKRTLFHSNSSNFFKSISPKNNREQSRAAETARLTDIYKTRIESNSKSFRKLCTKFNDLNETLSTNKVLSQTPPPSLVSLQELRQETVLPQKAELPSTDYLPEFKLL